MEEHARLRGVPFTFVHVAFYFENFVNYFSPRKQADGTYGFGFPLAEAPLASLAVDDTGGVVTAIIENRAEFLGATVEIVGDQIRRSTAVLLPIGVKWCQSRWRISF